MSFTFLKTYVLQRMIIIQNSDKRFISWKSLKWTYLCQVNTIIYYFYALWLADIFYINLGRFRTNSMFKCRCRAIYVDIIWYAFASKRHHRVITNKQYLLLTNGIYINGCFHWFYAINIFTSISLCLHNQ